MMATMNNDGQNGRSLPDGWEWKTIGNVANINGRDIAIRDLADDLPVTFVPMSAVNAEQGIIAKPQERPLKDVRKGFTPFSDGDVLLAKITPSMENGKAAIARNLKNGRGFGSTEFHVFRPKEVVIAEWIFHFIRQESFRRDAKANFSGTAGQLRVPSGFLVDYPIPLPPLPEQERIANRIDELLSDLDAGVAALERVRVGLKRYKASALKAAITGKLFNGKLEIGEGELPEGWRWATIEEACERIVDCLHSTPKFQDNGFYCVDSNWIKPGRFVFEKARFVDESTFIERNRRMVPQYDDVVFSREGALLGVAVHIPEKFEFCLGQRMMIFRPSINLDGKFLETFLNSETFKKQYAKQITGSASPHLNIGDIRKSLIPLPPLDEQRRIVAEVERRLSVVGEVESAVEAGLVRAGRLRQSVLRSAFEGRL
jgi:type I restriction enzyme S subunit